MGGGFLSTFLGVGRFQTLKSEEDLLYYFESFVKARDAMRIGVEVELFAVDRETGKALPYHGPKGIFQILQRLAQTFQYEPVMEGEAIVALKRGDTLVSLEPGGQVELSAPPVDSIFDVETQIQNFLNELRTVRSQIPGIEWLAVGIQPFSALHEIPWVPKQRYAIMREHFKFRGLLSHFMMKCTATNQVSLDYSSEEDAMMSLRVVLAITSIVTALFASSSISEGKPNGFLSKRLEIWNYTDPDRTGLLPDFIEEGKTFRDYLDYLLEMPMLFLVRQRHWIPVRQRTFRQFVRDGFEGFQATLDDFELHLSTAFPEVRLKQYLEIRGADGQSPSLIPSVAAFWKGILYDATARQKAWELVSFASLSERMRLHREIPHKGLQAQLGSRTIFPIAEELVHLACAGLEQQKRTSNRRNERLFLNRIKKEILEKGQSPAEKILDKWQNEFEGNPSRLIKYLSIDYQQVA